ncbi:MAG: hypothetical protein C0443_07575 [Comamonadaceae bacterium]|nr:hypothetical protein [Comamonadaceae bacterium]
MKLKLIAAAAVLAATGAAQAAPIDQGTDGHSDFIFSIWDTTRSYTANLNLQQNVFTAAVAAPGAYSFSRALSADPLFAAFISGANLAELTWNVLAAESLSGRTIHQTYTPGTLPAEAQTATNGRGMVGTIQTFMGRVNDAMAPGGNSVFITSTTAPAYAGNFGCFNNFATQEFNNCGTLANNSVATGLGLVVETYASSGTSRGLFTPLSDGGLPMSVYLDASYNLQMAPVPEPETYAMLLAGLGLMGALARRRQNKG